MSARRVVFIERLLRRHVGPPLATRNAISIGMALATILHPGRSEIRYNRAMSRLLAAAVALVLLSAGCSHKPAAPDFTLTDQTGRPWSLSAQRGTPVQLYFGYTHCIDTCPTTLARLAKADAGTKTIVAFVTVDPERDTPAALARYVKRFGYRRIVGLTGTPAEITRVEKLYHVWSQRIPGKHGSSSYDEAHISVLFTIAGDGSLTVHTQ